MRTSHIAKNFAVAGLVGAIAIAGAACEVEDDPEVIEQTTEETDVVEDEETVTEEETTVETETETAEPTEDES